MYTYATMRLITGNARTVKPSRAKHSLQCMYGCGIVCLYRYTDITYDYRSGTASRHINNNGIRFFELDVNARDTALYPEHDVTGDVPSFDPRRRPQFSQEVVNNSPYKVTSPRQLDSTTV